MLWPKSGHPIALGGSGAVTELSGDELGQRMRWDVNRARAFQKAVKMERMRRTTLGDWFEGEEGTEVERMEVDDRTRSRRSCLLAWKEL